MSWFRIDDQAHAHRKFRRAAKKHPGSVGLWMICGSLASSAACDGSGHLMADEVETVALSMGIRDWQKAADALVTCGDPGGAGLWERTETGFQFHDWEHYREGGEEELRRVRKSAAERQRAKRERDRARDVSRDAVTDSHVTGDVTRHVTPSRPPRPDPTRPDHKHPDPSEGVTADCVTQVWPDSEPTDPSARLNALRVDWSKAHDDIGAGSGFGLQAPDKLEENLALEALWVDARDRYGVSWADYPAKLRGKLVAWRESVDAKYVSRRPASLAAWITRVREEERREEQESTHDGRVPSLRRTR